MPDVLVNYYRKDILCNEEEQKNFKAKYNQKLPCTPEEIDEIDWDMFEKIGEFFQRKKGEKLAGKPLDDDFYGIAYQAGKAYDFSYHAGQRLHLAARRRHLGRDQGARRAMPRAWSTRRRRSRRSITICA